MGKDMSSLDNYRFSRIPKKRTKLFTDIWVDDTGISWEEEPPSALIWFSNYRVASGKQERITMSVSENPQVISDENCKNGFSEWEVEELVLFIRANSSGLLRLANPQDEYDICDFLREMKTGDDFNKVNMEIVETDKGSIQIVSPNEYGQLVLPQDWYESEDDVYDERYHEEVDED